MMKLRTWHFLAICPLALVAVGIQSPDELDRLIKTQMARRQIVGLSLAVIHEGRIVETRAYGTTTRDGKIPVTQQTLFQAGSVSKPVSALGALRLVDTGKLSLDDDVNTKLKSWRVPDNEFTTIERVTLRRLLTHTAGLNVSGFPGYELTERMPSVREVLDGRGNTAPVRVDIVPGSDWRYSGGGYVVMQQLVEDVGGKPFAIYMSEEVLKPLGMTNSTFQQPLPAALRTQAAAGYLADRSAVPRGWHAFAELAAAGLWTTPTDLAKYVIGVQQAFAGKSKVLSADITRQMLTVQRAGMGLGPAVQQTGANLRFMHNGRTRGFDTILIADARADGDGLVVMMNENDNTLFSQGNCCENRIVNFVAKKYKWPNYDFPAAPEIVVPANVPPNVLLDVTGRYEFQNPTMIALGAQNGRVYTYVDGSPDEEFVPTSDDRFVSAEHAVSFKLSRNAMGEVEGIDWTYLTEKTRRIPRIGPLFSSIPSNADDPDPTYTRNVLTVVHMLASGKGAAESPLLTAGAHKEFSNVAIRSLQGVRAITFLHESNVAGRGIERLGHPIQRALHYRMDTERGQRWLLVHVAANGLVADFDVVNN
jgi:CubicO group peptidase (beta-lactamase class C family)